VVAAQSRNLVILAYCSSTYWGEKSRGITRKTRLSINTERYLVVNYWGVAPVCPSAKRKRTSRNVML
jgi:hypothetical protein